MRFGASAGLVESTIADCETRDSRGGGAYVDQANLTLQGGSRVERCLAEQGGGLYVWEAEIALLEGSVLSECRAKFAGGLRARRVAHVERALCPRTRGGSMPPGRAQGRPSASSLLSLGGCPATAARCPWP